MPFNLGSVKKKEVSIVIIPSSSYKKKEMDVVKHLSKKFKSMCYVNVGRSFDSLIQELKKNEINDEKILFVDCSENLGTKHKNCLRVGSPYALTKLSVTIKKTLKTNKLNVLLFDSLSSLLSYHPPRTLTKFIHDLFSEIKKSEIIAVFPVQSGTDESFLADISMFADHVITYGKAPKNKKVHAAVGMGVAVFLIGGLILATGNQITGAAVAVKNSSVSLWGITTFLIIAFLTGLVTFLNKRKNPKNKLKKVRKKK
jgi:hypothetical protein